MFNRTYRYLTEQPLYPFGFGLSYSTFSYSDVGFSDLSPSGPNDAVELKKKTAFPATPSLTQISGSAPIYVYARITNSSSVAGDEVAELYISHPGQDGAPIRALVGFKRVHLAPAAVQFVSFVLGPRELSIVDPSGQRQVPAGPVELWLGSSQSAETAHQPGATLKFTIPTVTTLPN
jgi:beta-glucosidase